MQRSIDRFLAANKEWITEKSALLLQPVTIENGALIPFMGNNHLIYIEQHSKRTTEIDVEDNKIIIKTARADPTTNLKRWIIEQARDAITPLALAKSTCIKKTISKIDLRDTGSRWGSCSTDKRLMFSWRLIMAPHYVLDYVVSHEVAHLKHMDHSAKFWNVCYDLTDGDADAARAWLKQNGNDLMRWF